MFPDDLCSLSQTCRCLRNSTSRGSVGKVFFEELPVCVASAFDDNVLAFWVRIVSDFVGRAGLTLEPR